MLKYKNIVKVAVVGLAAFGLYGCGDASIGANTNEIAELPSMTNSDAENQLSVDVVNHSSVVYMNMGTCAPSESNIHRGDKVTWRFLKAKNIDAATIASSEYEWQFDGVVGENRAVMGLPGISVSGISYAEAGEYYATLTITDASGRKSWVTCDPVYVDVAPSADEESLDLNGDAVGSCAPSEAVVYPGDELTWTFSRNANFSPAMMMSSTFSWFIDGSSLGGYEAEGLAGAKVSNVYYKAPGKHTAYLRVQTAEDEVFWIDCQPVMVYGAIKEVPLPKDGEKALSAEENAAAVGTCAPSRAAVNRGDMVTWTFTKGSGVSPSFVMSNVFEWHIDGGLSESLEIYGMAGIKVPDVSYAEAGTYSAYVIMKTADKDIRVDCASVEVK